VTGKLVLENSPGAVLSAFVPATADVVVSAEHPAGRQRTGPLWSTLRWSPGAELPSDQVGVTIDAAGWG
jgi:hypothetical protein